MFVLNKADRQSSIEKLVNYFVETMGYNNLWSVQVLMAHSLYLANVLGQIFLTDCFLGFEFRKYGVDVASFLEEKRDGKIDSMSRVFPRVTKCTFHNYGPSGSIQVDKHISYYEICS